MATIFVTKAQKQARYDYLVDYLERNGYQLVTHDDYPESIQRLVNEAITLGKELESVASLYDVLVKIDSNIGSYGMEFDGMFCRWPSVNVDAEPDDTALNGSIDDENHFSFTKAELLAATGPIDGVWTVNGVDISLYKVQQVLDF